MNQRLTAVRATLATAAGLAVALPCAAQDAAGRPVRTTTTTPPTSPGARDDAARTMPAYEAFGASATANTTESGDRLNRDFASTSELGMRRIGAVPIWPRGDMKIGNVRIFPYLREGVEYVSNFYRVHKTGGYGHENANEAAWTHINQVGLSADAAFAGGRLKLASTINAEWAIRYGDGDDDKGTYPNGLDVDPKKDDTFEFNGDVGASYRFPSGVYVRGGVGYERRSDPIDVVLTRSFKRTNRRSYLTAGMDRDILFGSKFKFEMGAAVRDTIGREDGLDDLDRTEAHYYFKASYPFWKNTTRIFGRARYRQDERESDMINDGNIWGFDAGIEGSIPLAEGNVRGLRGTMSVGFDHALYENENFLAGSTPTVRDENRENTSVAVNTTLQYLNAGRDQYDLRYIRTNQFSFHGNFQIVDRVDLGYTRIFSPRFSGKVAGFFEYLQPSGRIRPQEVGKSDTTGDYPNTTRFGAGAGVRYRLNDWADLDAQYDWDRRNNPISGNTNHRASLGVTVYLNALKPQWRPGSGTPTFEVTLPDFTSSAKPAATQPAAQPSGKTPTTAAKAPTVPAALGTANLQVRGNVKVEPPGATGRAGTILRVKDAASSARVTFADGGFVEVSGPDAIVRIVSLASDGNRIQLIRGTITEASVGAVALEIQTPLDASLVLQNAKATARMDPKQGVTFRRLSGEFARVYSAGGSSELGAAAWTLAAPR